MTGPLDGIRVLDLSSGIAGPLAGMLLADFGADVVKAEPPDGDPARALPGFAVWNRNKRSIVVDRSGSRGRERLAQFLAGADILVLNAADVEMEPTALVEKYPRLVVLHMPPYTPGHTPWTGGKESHPLLAAYGGAAWRQSSFDGGPIDLVYPFPLYVQGHWAAGTAVAALIERLHSGRGQVATVGGMHGIMLSCVGQLSIVPDQAALPTNVGPGGRHPCYTTYQAGDGLWLFMAALTPKFQANAFKVLGVGDIFADERIKGVPARMLLPENRGWIRQLLADAFRTRTRDEWLRALEQGDCPAGPLGERDEWLDNPQVCANNMRLELDDPERGRVVMPGVHLVLTETPGSVRTPAPTLGQHDDEVQPWPEQPAASAGQGRSTSGRGPLAGYTVLNLGTILAGPYAGALLSEMGAEVVKVEAPVGDPFRETGFVYNRGQRGLAVDLTSDAAREAFYSVVRNSDVVLDNSRLGVLHRLKIDYATLKRVKSDIVTLSVNGFGEEGPLASKPGFDPVLQAMSGMMKAQGGDCDPYLFTIPINDIAAATVSVLGICLGLFHRERTGAGQRMWTSLLGCSAMMQSGELVRFSGRTPAIRGARDFAGPDALDRFYATADGYIRLQAPDAAALCRAGLLLPRDDESRVQEILTSRFAGMTASAAVDCLTRAGIPAVRARLPGELPLDADLQALEMFVTLHMQDGSPFYTTGRYARFSRTPQDGLFTPPGVGEHSSQVLAEAGVESAEIQALVDAGAVRQGTPFQIAGIQNYR